MGFSDIWNKGLTSLKINPVEAKTVPIITLLDETTREGLHKAYIPKFLYKPPYGYPRFTDIPYIRFLATTPYVEMCITTIIDEISAIDWDIVPTPGMEDQADEAEKMHIKTFFQNPNTNFETFEDVFIRGPVRDVLEVNTGVIVKVFNLKGDMVEVVARDGATFTKNPNIRGMFTHRADILIGKEIVDEENVIVNHFQHIPQTIVRELAAYFQYGWVSGPIPVPFGKREIVWIQKQLRTDDHYGVSAVSILWKNLQTLIYMIESDLEYFNDNNVPKGIIGFEGVEMDQLKAFQKQWNEQQTRKDEVGNTKKIMNKVPVMNVIPKFERIEFSSMELQLIEKQQWWAKMVWATFGVTATQLGYTEDAQGQANQIVQTKVFKKKAINPMLRLLEHRYNLDIVSEFGYVGTMDIDGKQSIEMPKYQFKFLTEDLDEERNKAELFKLQTESGLKTINEVRVAEGMEEVEWGDGPPNSWKQSENTFNINGRDNNNFDKTQREAQKVDDARKLPEAEEPDESMKEQEKKALTVENPLILKEKETRKLLEEEMIAIFKELAEETRIRLIKAIDDEVKKDVLKQIKSKDKKAIEDVIEKLKSFITFDSLKNIVFEGVKANFMKSFEAAEVDMNRNFVPDTRAIDFIADYTFENVKDMTEEMKNDLRQQLQIGIMNGEGADSLKARVNKIFNTTEHRAATIARTESNRASNFGKLQAYRKDIDNEYVKSIQITSDNRTSEVSKAMDRKYGTKDKGISLDEEFEVTVSGIIYKGQAPPFMPNDRDILIVDLVEEE